MEATKKICYVKDEGVVEHSKWLKKFSSGCKNLDNQVRSRWSKSVESEGVFQAIDANLVSSIWRVSGKLGI